MQKLPKEGKYEYSFQIKSELAKFTNDWKAIRERVGIFLKPGPNYGKAYIIHLKPGSQGEAIPLDSKVSQDGNFLSLKTQIKFELFSNYTGPLEFSFRAWDGRNRDEQSLGPTSKLETYVVGGIQTDSEEKKFPKIKTKLKIQPSIVPPVPYGAPQLGKKVGEISSQLFDSASDLGIVVVETGTGKFGMGFCVKNMESLKNCLK